MDATFHGANAQLSTHQTPQYQHSYAQLLDPNEGTELKFIPSSNINGVYCTKIEKSDVVDEVAYWQTAVLCTVMGANPPLEIIKGFLNRIWANFAIDRILYVRKGVFLVRFSHLQDKIQVEKRGFYFFDSKPMLVKGWNPNMDLQTETIRSLPLWIQLPSLDIKYWGVECLSKLGSLLGTPIKTDKITKDKQAIRYARLLVEMPIEGPFPEHIDFFNEEGVLTHQQVSYEWVPTKCCHCAMLGHTEDVCRKKAGVVRTVWRKKAHPPSVPPTVRVQPGPSPPPHHLSVWPLLLNVRHLLLRPHPRMNSPWFPRGPLLGGQRSSLITLRVSNTTALRR